MSRSFLNPLDISFCFGKDSLATCFQVFSLQIPVDGYSGFFSGSDSLNYILWPGYHVATGKHALLTGSQRLAVYLDNISLAKLDFETRGDIGSLTYTGYDVIEFHYEFAARHWHRTAPAAGIGLSEFHLYTFQFQTPAFLFTYFARCRQKDDVYAFM